MSLLSNADVASMRETLEQSLPDTAVVQTPSYADNLGGGGTLAWTASGTFDCRISALSGNEEATANRIAAHADWMLTLPATTAIDTDDRVVVGGRTFNVLALHAPRSWELSRRCEVNEAV